MCHAVPPHYGSRVSTPRTGTLAGMLARMGFADPPRAEHLITEELRFDADGADADVLAAIAAAADPDLALTSLAGLLQRSGDAAGSRVARRAAARARLRDRLTAVLGASAALGDHLHRHPDDWRVLRGPDGLRRPAAGESRAALLSAVGADPYDAEPVAASPAQPVAPPTWHGQPTGTSRPTGTSLAGGGPVPRTGRQRRRVPRASHDVPAAPAARPPARRAARPPPRPAARKEPTR